MRTCSSSNLVGETSTNPKRRNRRRSKKIVKPFSLEETPVVTMADQRTMAELLRAPTEGYAEAIVVPPIHAEHFELKHSLINLVTLKQFFSFEKEDPHAHIRYFNKITSTLKYKDVPETSIKLMLFPFSINETFSEAWDLFKDLLRACPHHGFTELHQLDTFYNGLNPSDQDSLNSAAGGNLLERSTQDVLKIIENKSKVCTSRNKPIVSQVKASSVDSSEIASAMTSAMTAMFKHHQVTPTSASVKAIEESCVTCGGAHSYRQCHAADGNTFSGYQDNIQGYVSTAAVNYNQGNTGNTSYQALIETQVTTSSDLEKFKKTNEASMQAMRNHISNLKLELRNEMQCTIQNQNNTFKNEMRSEMQVTMSNKTNELKNMMASFFQMNTASSSGTGLLPSNTIANPRGDLKAITTRSGISYDGPPIPPPFSPFPKVVEREPEVTKYMVQPSVAEDVFVKVGKFHNPADFVVVDYDADPRVPIILGRHFLRTARALIDVYDEEITLRFNDEAITFKVGQTLRYSYNNSESVNRIDVIDVSCEEYAQQVLVFSYSSKSGNPTPSLDPILSTSFPSLTPFEGGDFILEEIDACLTNDSIPPRIDDADFDPEGDLLLLEKLLNYDPSSPLPPKELHFEELKR
ncbi:reverse transcriptase domain-containing protein [Tanacetum coccineum]